MKLIVGFSPMADPDPTNHRANRTALAILWKRVTDWMMDFYLKTRTPLDQFLTVADDRALHQAISDHLALSGYLQRAHASAGDEMTDIQE